MSCGPHRLARTLFRRALLVTIAALAMLAALPALASADETVLVCDIYGNHVAPAPSWIYGIRTSSRCPGDAAARDSGPTRAPGGLAIWTLARKSVHAGERVQWAVRAPKGLVIQSVYIPHMYSQGIDDGSGWGGGFSWSGGSNGVATFDEESSWSSGSQGRPRFAWPSGGTHYFAWRVGCRSARCRNGGHQWLSIELLELRARETRGPRLVATTGLWDATGWIRGPWKLSYSGDSPTGVCALSASVNGRSYPGAVSSQNPAVWHQCATPAVNQTVDTAQYGQGPLPLTIRAIDAAGGSSSRTRTIEVDNVKPTLSLSGPTDAPNPSGTQYVHATATAGPSGVVGIVCSLDLARARLYPLTNLNVPVRGVGVHHLSCYSVSHARDASGHLATSAPVSWTLSIRSPSASTLSFVRIGDALRCRREREWEWIPPHSTTGSRNGRRVEVRVPGHHRRVEVVRCHPRVVHRRVRKNGRWTTQRVILLPHRVAVNHLQVRFGARPKVSGWLGTTNGNALGGQLVRILTAPANGAGKFTQAAVVRSAPDGVWTAQLPAGPSRLVEAWYSGARTVEPSVSEPAHLAVTASLKLAVHPQLTHWGDTIRLSGAVRGGYIPPGGEIIFLWVGWKGGSAEIGHLYTQSDGTFRTRYTFLRGNGTQTYTMWATSVHEGDYPYAPGTSNRVRVKVEP